jgi:hypothetical protein
MLVVCAACARHVRSSEEACPFCAEPVAPRSGAIVAAALVAVGAAAFVACGRESPRALYGAPPAAFVEAGTTVTVIPPDDAGR